MVGSEISTDLAESQAARQHRAITTPYLGAPWFFFARHKTVDSSGIIDRQDNDGNGLMCARQT